MCQDEYLSTTKISRLYGLTAKPTVFNYLMSEKFIYKNGKYYELLEKGKQYGYMYETDNGRWIVWNKRTFSPIIQMLKKQVMDNHKQKFQLFHMTHINNLSSIIQHGLLSHNLVNQPYIDISNQSVNQRREKAETIFNHSIHDYVPLYFNVKNAMLYAVQSYYKDEIIILEINKDICLQEQTLFSYMNASTNQAVFQFCLQKFLDKTDWNSIYQRTWVDNLHIKQAMMSECLIYNVIEASCIQNIHCQSENTAQFICNTCNQFLNKNNITVYYNSNLFF